MLSRLGAWALRAVAAAGVALLPLALVALPLAGCAATRPFANSPPSSSRAWTGAADAAPATADATNATDATEAEAARAETGSAPHARRSGALARGDTAGALARGDAAPGHEYSLAELIDLAERTNPETRVSWLRARGAALDVAVAAGAYFPLLSLAFAGGIGRGVFPLPLQLESQGTFTADAFALRPELAVDWLLLDFGGRAALVDQARALRDAGNAAFNATHERIAIEVALGFYRLATMQSKVELADAALADAKSIEEATALAREQGVATTPEALLAAQNLARARWDREVVVSLRRDAEVALAQAVGLDPRTPLRVEPLGDADAPTLDDALDRLIEHALATRPDLLALAAEVRAAEGAVASAESNLFPKLVLRANGGPAYLGFRVDDSRWVTTDAWLYGALVALEWPLFTGLAETNLVRRAETARGLLEQQLEAAKNVAIRQIWQAYTAAKNAERKRAVADSLLAASQSSYDATRAAYENGAATLPELLTAQTALAAARANVAETRAEIRAAAATLSFAAGTLSARDAAP